MLGMCHILCMELDLELDYSKRAMHLRQGGREGGHRGYLARAPLSVLVH